MSIKSFYITALGLLATMLVLACALPAKADVVTNSLGYPVYESLRWSVEMSENQPKQLYFYRGETVDMTVYHKLYSVPLQVTNPETICTFYWQTNGMDNAWWTTNATISSTGVAGARWTPQMDIGADRYIYFFGLSDNNTTSLVYRANGNVNILYSPGQTPNMISMPIEVFDFNSIPVLNPPYYSKAEVLGLLGFKLDTSVFTAYTNAATQAISLKLNTSIFNTYSNDVYQALGMKVDEAVLNEVVSNVVVALSGKLDVSVFTGYTNDATQAVALKLNTSIFTAYTNDNEQALAAKLNASIFNQYVIDTDSDITNLAHIVSLKLYTSVFDTYTNQTDQTLGSLQSTLGTKADATSIPTPGCGTLSGASLVLGSPYIHYRAVQSDATLNIATNAPLWAYDILILGNNITLGTGLTLRGTWTQTGTNIVCIVPDSATTRTFSVYARGL